MMRMFIYSGGIVSCHENEPNIKEKTVLYARFIH